MQAAIAILETALEALEINAPINEREGNIEQARLERENAEEVREAINFLNYMKGKPREMFADYV